MDAPQFNRLLNIAYKDEKAFQQLYDFYYKRIVFKFLGQFGKDLAEDVAQDFFTKIVESDKKYEYINNPTAWVYTCCANIAKTKLAKENRTVPLEEDLCAENGSDLNCDKINIGIEIGQLDDLTRKIIILHYWKGYSFEEISKILDITYAALRQRHRRLKKKLKNILR